MQRRLPRDASARHPISDAMGIRLEPTTIMSLHGERPFLKLRRYRTLSYLVLM